MTAPNKKRIFNHQWKNVGKLMIIKIHIYILIGDLVLSAAIDSFVFYSHFDDFEGMNKLSNKLHKLNYLLTLYKLLNFRRQNNKYAKSDRQIDGYRKSSMLQR